MSRAALPKEKMDHRFRSKLAAMELAFYSQLLAVLITEILAEGIPIFVRGSQPELKFKYIDIDGRGNPTRRMDVWKQNLQTNIALFQDHPQLETLIPKFIEESDDPERDFLLLAHERGHSKSPSKDISPLYTKAENGTATRQDKAIILWEERFAWAWARKYADSKKYGGWSSFRQLRHASLATYRTIKTI